MRKVIIVAAACLATLGVTGVAQAQTWNGQQDPHHSNQTQIPVGAAGPWGQGYQNQTNWPQQYQVPFNQAPYNQGYYNQGYYNQGSQGHQGHHNNNQGWGGYNNQGWDGNNNQGWGANYNQGSQGHHNNNQGWGGNNNQGWGANQHHGRNGGSHGGHH